MPDIRVATYNLYLGADLAALFDVTGPEAFAAAVAQVRGQLEATRFEERAVAVARLLARDRPDLVGLQEVALWTTGLDDDERVLVDFLPTLSAALEAAGTPYDVHVVNENFGGALPVAEGEWMSLVGANVTLVRPDRVEVVAQEQGRFERGYEVVTGLEGVRIPVVRSWGCLDVRVDGAPLRFVNTHTEAYDATTRDAQRDEALAVAASVDGPVVLVGDLNTTPDLVGVPAPWVDAWGAGEGDGFTFGQAADLANEVGGMHERIDYVWVRGLGVVRAWTVGDRPEDRTVPHGLWPSDHAGVLADLALAPSVGTSPQRLGL